MADTASAQSVLDVVKQCGQEGEGQGQGKGRTRQEGPGRPSRPRQERQAAPDRKGQAAYRLQGPQRPSDQGQDRQGQARHKGQARHQGQDRQGPAHQRQGGERQARKGQDRKRQLAKDKIGKDKLAKDKSAKTRSQRTRPGRTWSRRTRVRKGPTVKDKGALDQIARSQRVRRQDGPRPVCAGEIAGRARQDPRRPPPRDRRRRGCGCRRARSPAAAGFTGVPPATETRFVSTEMVFHVGPNVSRASVEAAAARHGMIIVAEQPSAITGGTLYICQVPPRRPGRYRRARDGGGEHRHRNAELRVSASSRTPRPKPLPVLLAAGAAEQYVVDKLRLAEVHKVATGKEMLVAVIELQGRRPIIPISPARSPRSTTRSAARSRRTRTAQA